MATAIRKKKAINLDGLENALSQKGVAGRSKSGSNYYNGGELLSDAYLRDMYNSGGIGAKIITRVADDITSRGFELTGVEKTDLLIRKFKQLEGAVKFNTLFRWARLYGGAIMVIRAMDGRSLDKPLNINKIDDIEGLDVIEAGMSRNVSVLKTYPDSTKANYGKPEIYSVSGLALNSVPVHESRIIRMDGRTADIQTKRLTSDWGMSELQPVYESLLSLMSVIKSGEQVLDEMVIGTLKMENLDALCATDEGIAQVRKRLDLVDTSKSNENTIAISANEDYVRHVVNLSGMEKIQQNVMLMVSGAADMPATHIFGRSPQGENATGESDERQYNAKVYSEQEHRYSPALMRLFELICLSSKFQGPKSVEEMEISFIPIKENTLFDTARAMDSASKALSNLVKDGVITAAEAKELVFSGNFGLDLIKKVRT